MKIKCAVTAIAVLTATSAPGTAMAQASIAMKAGEFVASKVASALLGEAAGKAFAAIFGDGQDQVTIEQIEGAINKAF